ncbi:MULTISPECIES: GNAT family N-acetyltransferase [unclassified Phenylobacterium]|uniref:GNAT family N-acetyltransferase n=1 Tax=unclassified Phenylobacterium TaxID=2640670 RepID=UPI0009EC5872|nr:MULTISPECIES: GNAT family N-acetyltransferase [unclassified Phenylobacterium]
MIIRAAEAGDAQALAAIYGHHVLHGFGTFEIEPPDAAWMEGRRREIQGYGLPFFVAEDGGRVLGYAYAGPFRPRPGYRFTAEDSVYVAPDAVGRGVGRAVLSRVMDACEAFGLRQVVAVIGDSGNAASIGLHRALGFEDAGVGRSFGFKHGRWVDIVWMQKSLNGGDETAPTGPGIKLSGS